MNKKLALAWIASIIATLGSLFLSEVLHFTPCKLCWFQRICMYPLVVVLGIAVFKNDLKVYRYALPLSLIGMCISVYHYGVQKVPFMKENLVCSEGVPCSQDYLGYFGFITIPLLAFVAFVIILSCMIGLKKQQN